MESDDGSPNQTFALTGFVERESKAAELAVLRHSSIDLYAALRSAYTQDREAAIWHRREHHHASGNSRVH